MHRKVVERAVAELLPYRQEDSGLLFVVPEGRAGLCAPTYENFLFTLLLLRRKCVESTVAAKTVLARLLHFQDTDPNSAQYGNFPFTLEEYPECRDWLTSVRIGAVVFLINQFFGHVLGEDLLEKLRLCHSRLLEASERVKRTICLPPYAQALLALQKDGGGAAISTFLATPDAFSPAHLGRILALAKARDCEEEILAFATTRWHALLGTYAGPACGVFQMGGAPEVTLFDIEMALSLQKPLPNRPWSYRTCLEAAYSMPKTVFLEHAFPDMIVSPCLYIPKCPHGYHPVRIVMECGTVSIQTPGGELVELKETPEGFEGTVFRTAGATDSVLLRAFMERGELTSVTVEGERATVFTPERGVTLECGKKQVLLTVSLSSTIGHIRFGDRPGQLLEKGAYDWVVEVEHLSGPVPDRFTFFVYPFQLENRLYNERTPRDKGDEKGSCIRDTGPFSSPLSRERSLECKGDSPTEMGIKV